MKLVRSLLVALALGVSASAAQAHGSFQIGISLGAYGAPVVAYPAAPVVAHPTVQPVIYYNAPGVYHPAPHAYYRAPAVGYRDVYYGAPRHHFSGHKQYRGNVQPGHGQRGHFR